MNEEIENRIDSLVATVTNLMNQRVEETIFELLTIAGVATFQGLKATDYEINHEYNAYKLRYIISLYKGPKHIITYVVFYDSKNGKVVRERKVNDI